MQLGCYFGGLQRNTEGKKYLYASSPTKQEKQQIKLAEYLSFVLRYSSFHSLFSLLGFCKDVIPVISWQKLSLSQIFHRHLAKKVTELGCSSHWAGKEAEARRG